MSTPSHGRGSTSSTTKRVTLHHAYDHFELHEINTYNEAKRLSFSLMQMYDLVLILHSLLEVIVYLFL